MKSSKTKLLSLYSILKKELSSVPVTDIENGVMVYCLANYGEDTSIYRNENSEIVATKLEHFDFPTDWEAITGFFESLLEKDSKNENGIVFTPQYIAEYIASSVISQESPDIHKKRIIDPGCGCGIFLVAAAEFILSITKQPIDSIIENNIYGIDIIEDNARRCKLVLKLLSAKHGGRYEKIHPNIICKDSLKINWASTFDVNSFDFIIGNPPYVNPHDMDKKMANFLKKNYATTQNGVFNIFYAFIEKGMQQLHPHGLLSFIIPNNFLTIKSARNLRDYLQTNSFIKRILDFGNNMVFKPVRTYNCIIQASKGNNLTFEYCVLPTTNNIEKDLLDAVFTRTDASALDKNGWKLVNEKTHRNLHKIENQPICIKTFIRTGIATLRDGVYFVEKDDGGYYKCLSDKKIYIEPDLVKPIYKIPELKRHNSINEAKRYIIFPYIKSKTGYSLIDENNFANQFPRTYKCLLMQQDKLGERDKGKGAVQGWYAYGRTQGLNKYGRKILFPTFSDNPKFMYVDDRDALFCNGYAVFENGCYDLDILVRILNSHLMKYYVSNTSYSIEGGYYCYQKKYVERFSLPWFSERELAFIRGASKSELDSFLWARYGLE